ncbi:HlyD family secretion protein [Lusitaniella coriacea]|uniref:HlyD family secretion protein n=1 Tax=Lusitaniella coriacea TaxID=1983105 RepID=UPI003CEB5D7D
MTQTSLNQPKSPENEAIARPKRKISPKLLIPVGVLIAGIAGASWYFLSPSPEEPLAVSGRIEGYETLIGAKVAGRVESVVPREGDVVKAGETIARMDDDELQAQLRGAKARLIAAQQQSEQARLQINVLESQIQEMQLNRQQAQGDAQGKVGQAEAVIAASIAQLKAAEAQREQAQAELRLAKADRDRFSKLVAQGAVPQQRFDQAQTAFETTSANVQARQAAVESARKQVNVARSQLTQAQTSELNPDIRNTQLQSLRTQLAQSRLKLAATQADVTSAKAQQQEIQSRINDLNIISPIDGVVVTRSVEPGAVVTTGKTLLTVINPDEVYLRGFIPEGKIGEVRIGQDARVFLDSAPDRALDAKVSAIDTQASFTPENIYFKEDRVQQVFGVKISLESPEGYAKPGMPADAEIVTELANR